MNAEMKTYSVKFRLFSWLHIQSYAGLVIAGSCFTLLLKLCMQSRYRIYSEAYDSYVSSAGLTGLPAGCKQAYFASMLIYGAFVREFFLYDFIHLNDRGRRTFFTEINRYQLYRSCNGASKRIEMQDKFLAYESFRKYYHREIMRITKETSPMETEAFFSRCRNREGCILKPNFAGCGRGVEIVKPEDFASREEMYAYICSKEGFVIEELVQQTGLMQELHPQSVNTVRIYACRADDGIRIFGSHLRIGVGASIVDNAAQGGIAVSITNDGSAWTSGVDEYGKIYRFHPDTHICLSDIKVPEWEKALQIVKEAMDVIPDIRFVGWDLAYTADGWIMIEANDNAQFYGAQIPYHKGLRHEVAGYLEGSLGSPLP